MNRRMMLLGGTAGIACAMGAGVVVGYRLGQVGQDRPPDLQYLLNNNPKVELKRLSVDTLTKLLNGNLTDRDRRTIARELIRHNRGLFAEGALGRVPGEPGYLSVG